MSINHARFEFEPSKISLVFELINGLFEDSLRSELGEPEEAQLLRELQYELAIETQNVKIRFYCRTETNNITAHTECANADDFASIKMLFSFTGLIAQDKNLYGIPEFLETIFSDIPRPDTKEMMGGSAEHLANCRECSEALENFGSKRWQDVSMGWEVPLQYADFTLLSPPAQLYFFPAYLLACVKNKSTAYLETLELNHARGNFVLNHPQEVATKFIRSFVYFLWEEESRIEGII